MIGLRALPPAAAPVGAQGLWRALVGSQRAQADFGHVLATYLRVPHVYLAESGRSALFLLLDALRSRSEMGGRDEVVLPAYTCPALTKVILDAGLRPRWVDLDPQSMEMSDADVARCVGASTLALMIVHPFGLPHPLTTFRQIADAAGALLIEDAAQSMGACDKGERVGTRSDFGLFSLGPGKPLSTGGGGFLVTDQIQHAQLLDERWRSLAAPGGNASLLAILRLGLIETLFHPLVWGIAAQAGIQRIGDSEASWGFRLQGLTNAQCAVGQQQLPQLDESNAQRRDIAAQLARIIGRSDRLRTPVPKQVAGYKHGLDEERASSRAWQPIYLRFPILAHDGAARDGLYRDLVRAGIGAGKMYRKTMADFFPHIPSGPYPGAQQIVETILTLPTHRYVREQDLATIERVLQRWM